jgi:hypothetical protein
LLLLLSFLRTYCTFLNSRASVLLLFSFFPRVICWIRAASTTSSSARHGGGRTSTENKTKPIYIYIGTHSQREPAAVDNHGKRSLTVSVRGTLSKTFENSAAYCALTGSCAVLDAQEELGNRHTHTKSRTDDKISNIGRRQHSSLPLPLHVHR